MTADDRTRRKTQPQTGPGDYRAGELCVDYEAAAQSGLAEVTLRRWLKHAAFQTAYREARRAVVQHAIVAVQQATEAVATLQCRGPRDLGRCKGECREDDPRDGRQSGGAGGSRSPITALEAQGPPR